MARRTDPARSSAPAATRVRASVPRLEPLAPMPRDPAAALAPYEPERGHGPWDARTVGHALRRALGGPRPGDLDAAALPSPVALHGRLFAARDVSAAEREARRGRALSHGERDRLAAWWMLKLVGEERAPGARLTLFWHDHFATTYEKVAELGLLYAQHQTFVEKGEGPFGELLRAMAWDPAMLRFLDGDSNRRGVPNENLAREVLELFGLGVGNYDERDVKEAARALTGRTVRRGRAAFVDAHHDPGEKTILGQPARDGDDFVRIVANHAACPRFLLRKLWRFYVSPEPPEGAIELLAERWRARDLDVAWAVEALVRSRAFYSAEAYRSLVKSPVDLVVGIVRGLGSRPDAVALVRACGRMGQTLLEPPGVQGWQGGEAWIHASTWLERVNFAGRVVEGADELRRGVELARLFPSSAGAAAAETVEELATAFLDGELDAASRRSLAAAGDAAPTESRFATTAHALLCLPDFHLS